MLIESVKRWTVVVLMIAVVLLVLVIMAMRVDAQAMQSKVSSLEQANQQLVEVAKDNADQVKAMKADAKANGVLSVSKQQAKAATREQTRSNTYVVHQSLSAEACATVPLPGRTLSMLRTSGSNQDRGTLPDSSGRSDP